MPVEPHKIAVLELFDLPPKGFPAAPKIALFGALQNPAFSLNLHKCVIFYSDSGSRHVRYRPHFL